MAAGPVRYGTTFAGPFAGQTPRKPRDGRKRLTPMEARDARRAAAARRVAAKALPSRMEQIPWAGPEGVCRFHANRGIDCTC